VVKSEVSGKSDLGGSFFHASETELKQLVRESLALLYHAADFRRIFLRLAAMVLNLGEASLPFESPVFIGGFDYRQNSPQALLWVALNSLCHHSREKVIDSVVAMTDTSYHLVQDRE
jgi:hypothetical protein